MYYFKLLVCTCHTFGLQSTEMGVQCIGCVKEHPFINPCGRKGNGIEQREKLNCNAGPGTASISPLGSCGAAVGPLRAAHLCCAEMTGPFYPICHQSWASSGSVALRKATELR